MTRLVRRNLTLLSSGFCSGFLRDEDFLEFSEVPGPTCSTEVSRPTSLLSNRVKGLSPFQNVDIFHSLMIEVLKVIPLTQWALIQIQSSQEPMGCFISHQVALLPLVKVHRNKEEEANPGTLCHFLEHSPMKWCEFISLAQFWLVEHNS